MTSYKAKYPFPPLDLTDTYVFWYSIKICGVAIKGKKYQGKAFLSTAHFIRVEWTCECGEN